MTPDLLATRMIDAAYRATLDASAWGAVTAPISSMSESLKCGLHAIDTVRQRVRHIGVGNISDEAIAAYGAYFFTRNAYDPIIMRTPAGTVCQPTDREIDELVEPSEFNHDWLTPNGLGLAGSAIVVLGSRGGRMDLRVNYPQKDREGLDALFGAALADAVPHFARALDLSIRSATTAFLAGAGSAVASSPVPTLVVGARATVLSANPAAEELLSDGPLFIDRNGRLRAKVMRDDEAVLAALGAVVRAGAEPALMRVRDFGAVGDVVLSIVPLDPGRDETERWLALLAEDAPVAVVYLSADVVGGSALEGALSEIFGLDPTEAALAVALARGQRLAAFAAARGIGTYDASLLLDRMMERLGAHRTGDVVRKVASLARVIATPAPFRCT